MPSSAIQLRAFLYITTKINYTMKRIILCCILCFTVLYVQSQPTESTKQKLGTKGYVDLGLPSSTIWKCCSEENTYTFKEAVESYKKNLPSAKQWQELIDKCKWEWYDEGEYYEQDGEVYKLDGDSWYKVIGPNGNYILLYANGFLFVDEDSETCVGCGGVGGVEGYYLSSDAKNKSILYLYFNKDSISIEELKSCYDFRCELNVHLVK